MVEEAESKIENVIVEVDGGLFSFSAKQTHSCIAILLTTAQISFNSGFQALYSLPQNTSAQTKEVDCQNHITTKDNMHFSFTFSICATATVTMVTPSSGVSSDIITIEGSDFGIRNEDNTVMFGSHVCTVTSSTATSITCNLDTSQSPIPVKPHAVSVHVKGLGYAIVAPAVNHTTAFELIPSSESITPKRGSIAGGTTVVITGQGFIDGMSLMIGGARCDVTQVLFTQITCTTTSAMTEKLNQTVELSLIKSNQQHTGICKNSDGCMFHFMDDQTPEVTNVQPVTISSPNTVITLNGVKVIWVGLHGVKGTP